MQEMFSETKDFNIINTSKYFLEVPNLDKAFYYPVFAFTSHAKFRLFNFRTISTCSQEQARL